MQWNETTEIPSSVAGLRISSFNPLTVCGEARMGVVVYGLCTGREIGAGNTFPS